MKGSTGLILSVAIGASLLGGIAYGQTFMCGNSVCGSDVQPWSVDVITGIDGLHVDGHVYDVIFSNTAPAVSPFVLSNTTSSVGQPLTGVDAGNALSAFYGSLVPPWDGYSMVGDPGPAFITAMAPAGAQSVNYFNSPILYDLAQTSVGGGFNSNMTEVVGSNFYHANGLGNPVLFTTWVPVNAAPELDGAGLSGALTLLAGALAVARLTKGGSKSP